MAFWIVLQNKTSFGVKSIFCKKDLFNLIQTYEGLVTHVAIPKKFGGVDWTEQTIFQLSDVAEPLHL